MQPGTSPTIGYLHKANDYLYLAYAKHGPDGKLDEQIGMRTRDDLGPQPLQLFQLAASCRKKFASSAIAGQSITLERTPQLKLEEIALDDNLLRPS